MSRTVYKSAATAARRWYLNWREPKWEMQPLGSMPLGYRCWMVGLALVQALFLLAAVGSGWIEVVPPSLLYATAAALVCALLSQSSLRAGSSAGWDNAQMVAVALVFSGRPAEAMVAVVAGHLAMALRKPLVPHLLVANVLNAATTVAVAASLFSMLGGDSSVLSLQWIMAAMVSVALVQSLDALSHSVPSVLGGYCRVGEAARGFASNGLSFVRSVAPVALLVGAVLTRDSAGYLLLLVVPQLVASDVFKRSEKLVETQEEARASLAHEAKKLARANLQFAAAMVRALDARDAYTAGHSAAVAVYARDIAKEAGADDEFVRTAHLAGLLHDIGKIGVPGRILNKDRALTDEEYELMKEHSAIGAKILAEVDSYSEMSMFVRYHHERIDGRGYPDGIPGELIPAISRIIAVADTYSAMTTDRPYRDGMPTQKAMGILQEVAGTQLDALYVESFLRVLERESDSYQRGKLAGFEVEVAKHEALSHAEEHVIEIADEPRRDSIAATAAELQRIADEAVAAASRQQAMEEQRAPQLTRPASETDIGAADPDMGSADAEPALPDNVVEHPTAHRKSA